MNETERTADVPRRQCLEGRAPPPAKVRLDPAKLTGDEEVNAGPKLLCAQCLNPITTDRARTEIAGSHVHDRINPAGYEFVFGCFTSAPGVSVSGAPTLEYSWFPASAWQFDHCAECGVHLGWYFSGAESFHALVLERLIEERAE